MSWKSPKPIFPQLHLENHESTPWVAGAPHRVLVEAPGSVSTARCERKCPVAMPTLTASLHWQRRLIAEFGVLPSGSCANKNCCHRSSVYKTLKKISTKQTHGFFRWKRFWNKQKVQPIIECKWPLVLGQDDSAQCCTSSFNDKYITALPITLILTELHTCPQIGLAIFFTTPRKLSKMNYPYRSCLFIRQLSFFVSRKEDLEPKSWIQKWLKENLHPLRRFGE